MSTKWTIDPSDLTTLLEERGFDIEQPETSLPEGGGSLSARMESGSRAFLVRTDAGGRLQILVTEHLVDEAAEPFEVSSVRLTVTESTIHRRTMRGTVTGLDQFRAILESLVPKEESRELPPV